jgi:hypothetical protein
MPKESNIVHQYFKKQLPDSCLLIRVNPLQFKVMEITVPKTGEPTVKELEADQDIIEDLKADGFLESSPLEFNLYFSGLIG